MGLPVAIVRTSLTEATNALARRPEPMSVAVHAEMQRLENAENRPGWLHWALEYRNMLVHRGRRRQSWPMRFSNATTWFDGSGSDHRGTVRTLPTVEIALALAAHPNLTDAEAHAQYGPADLVLGEDALTTLHGIGRAAVRYAAGTCYALALAWCERREHPQRIVQPPQQWAVRRAQGPHPQFAGWEPNSFRIDVGALRVHPNEIRRLRAAKLVR